MSQTCADQGYFVQYSTVAPARYTHRACGKNLYRGAACPNCARPLLLLFDLDATDPRLFPGPASATTRIPLLFCWRCGIAEEDLRYTVEAGMAVALLDYGIGEPSDEFPYADYPAAFAASWLDLTPITANVQATILRFNGSDESMFSYPKEVQANLVPRHQIGGTPVNPPEDTPTCVACGNEMRFLACVADDAPGDDSFCDNAGVRVFYYHCAADSLLLGRQGSD